MTIFAVFLHTSKPEGKKTFTFKLTESLMLSMTQRKMKMWKTGFLKNRELVKKSFWVYQAWFYQTVHSGQLKNRWFCCVVVMTESKYIFVYVLPILLNWSKT